MPTHNLFISQLDFTMTRFLISLTLLIFCVQGAFAASDNPQTDLRLLVGTYWQTEQNPQRTLQFVSEDGIAGNAGCNNYRSSISSSSDMIIVGPIATTKKLCAGDANAAESHFLQVLQSTRKVVKDGDRLELLDEEGVQLIRLVQILEK